MDQSTIISLTPNEAAYKRAEKLATAANWYDLTGNGEIVWGECKSSGTRYYKVQLCLSDNTYKCNCPSRKFPCKHALALMMLFVNNNDLFQVSDNPPEWVEEWVAKKRKGGKKSGRDTPEADKAKKDALKIKNQSARLELMQTGITELKIWLQDIIRHGTASLKEQPPEFWETFAGRMVDAKLGGIAKRIRLLPTIPDDTDWHESILTELSDLHLLVKSFQNLEKLPKTLQRDVLSIAGWNIKKEEVETGAPVTDDWFILATHEKWEEKLRARKTWLFGKNTGKYALILDFAWGNEDHEKQYITGKTMTGDLIFYPSAYPLRAIVKKWEAAGQQTTNITGYKDLQSMIEAYSIAIAQNPWVNTFPVLLSDVIPVYADGKYLLVDTAKHQLVIANNETSFWQIFALSGGNPVTVFGEWSKNKLLILSVSARNRYIDFSIKAEKRNFGYFPQY